MKTWKQKYQILQNRFYKFAKPDVIYKVESNIEILKTILDRLEYVRQVEMGKRVESANSEQKQITEIMLEETIREYSKYIKGEI